jgi:hypothetical protein
MDKKEVFVDHTGKPSMKRKIAFRSFQMAQVIAIFYMAVAIYAILVDKDIKSFPMVSEIFFSFMGSSLIAVGLNLPEYFSKLVDKQVK